LLALLLVAALGLFLHRPLARVPENSLKFAVGIMLTAFGIYWAGEGIGLQWPGQDASILLLIGVFLGLGLLLTRICGWLRKRAPAPVVVKAHAEGKQRGALAAAAGELLGLFVEDLWLAIGAAAWVAAAALVQARHPLMPTAACTLFAAGMAGILGASALRRAEHG
jgi:hypothetical protein